MRAAATFAAAYGFPPSACGTREEAIGLLMNLPMCQAMRSLSVAQGVAGVVNGDALGDMLEAVGASSKLVGDARFSAMRQEAAQAR